MSALHERRIERAEAFLKKFLTGNPMLAQDIYEHAKEAGIEKDVLKEAKERLGITTRNINRAKRARWMVWEWSLPPPPPEKKPRYLF